MTARAEAPMRTVNLQSGPVDIRLNEARDEVCIVFYAPDADLRLFRTMGIEEFRALLAHMTRVEEALSEEKP